MYDPKFEKEVQRKMEELEFSPSEAVWTHIEQAVNKEKKRRRIPFFWLFFLSGAFLLGAGAFIYGSRSHSGIQSAVPKAATLPPGGSTLSPEVLVKSSEVRVKSPEVLVKSPEVTALPPATPLVAAGTRRKVPGAAAGPLIGQSNGRGALKEGLDQSSNDGGKDRRDAEREETVNDGTTNKETGQRHSGGYRPELENFVFAAPRVTAAELAVKKTTRAVELPKPRHPWEAAFTGGIGITSLNRVQPASSPVPNAALAYSVPPNFSTSYYALTSPSLAAAGRSAKEPPSEIRPDLSFSAGIQARKELARRWTFTVGLDLLYYSTRMKVGQQVSSYVPVSGAQLGYLAAAPIQSYPYYTTGEGQSFTNRYYFLEIPASIQWQLNRSRSMPLFWEGGISLSYLMSSDALYYDPGTGVYFKDGNVTNRAQVSLGTSLMLGVSLGGGARLQVGPQVQYGLGSLLQTAAGTQHLFYGGVRVVVMPGKNKK
jgi:hypothetical protein